MASKMRLRTKILLGIATALVLVVAGYITLAYWAWDVHFSKVPPYQPDCKSDASCLAWTDFRTQHPYPYQEIAAKRLPDGSMVLIVSEPPPVMSKPDLERLVKVIFGPDFVSGKREQWKLLTDGWLEDLVLTVRAKTDVGLDSDPVFRERIAALYHALFGTTYGGMVDFFAGNQAGTAIGAPNVHVSPAELRRWTMDSDQTWHPVGYEWGSQGLALRDITSKNASGVFGSTDGTLIILAIPTKFLVQAPTDSHDLDLLLPQFRIFAVASDAIVGGLWTNDGQTLIVGRARTEPLTVVPPLRFETFSLLARQSVDELSQSYERTAIFAGKLNSGTYLYKDWAPVYLSDALIDTELGALLNTTDQLLKSWSEAGTVDYENFNYVRPHDFPFGKKTLSEIVTAETGSSSVTFNWNTAGFGVVVQRPDVSLLATRQVGALPVTYIAGTTDDQANAAIRKHEEDAYQYFAGQRDPNLERVVQYTTLYQVFRAVQKASAPTPLPSSDGFQKLRADSARSASRGILANATAKLLDDLEAGKLEGARKIYTDEMEPKLKAFYSRYPNTTNAKLARILADRFSDEATAYEHARQGALAKSRAQLESDGKKFEVDANAYNDKVRAAKADASGASDALALLTTKQELDRRQSDLENRLKTLEQESKEDPISSIRETLANIAAGAQDLEPVREAYVSHIPPTSTSSIKTPSIVVSWAGTHVLASTGGHNVDAQTLRLQMTPDVAGVNLKRTEEGYILQYNPSSAGEAEEQATSLARAIEHDNVREGEDLNKLLSTKAEERSAAAALEIPKSTAEDQPTWAQWSGHLGTKEYTGKSVFVGDLQAVAEKNECCVFIAHDDQEIAYVTESNPTPPPKVITIEVRDTPSLVDYLKQTSAKAGTKQPKAVVFFDDSEAHIKTLSLGIKDGAKSSAEPFEFEHSVAESASSSKGDRQIDALIQDDAKGRNSFLETIGKLTEKGRALLERLGIIHPKEIWEEVRVGSLDENTVQGFLKEVNWNTATDGVPSAIRLSFGPKAAGVLPSDLSIVAGFDKDELAIGAAHLSASSNENLALVSKDGASVAQYVLSVRNDLRTLSDAQLKRLVVVVNDKAETQIYISRRKYVDGSRSGL